MAYLSKLRLYRFVLRLLAVTAVCALLNAQIVAPVVVQKVEPEYGTDQGTFLIEPARVEMTADESGKVVALSSSSSLPDNLVQAFTKWRFTPGTKNGTRAAFSVAFHVPLKCPITDYLRRTGAPYSPHQRPWPAASKGAGHLTPEEAANLEKNLRDNAEGAEARAELLTYAAARSDKDSEEMRVRQISWLISNQPDDRVLGTSAALISPTSSNYATVRTLWLNQLASHPNNAVIFYNAIMFLRVSDPEKAEELLVPAVATIGGAATWLGRTYGLAALGVNRIDPEHGDPVIDEKQSGADSANHARSVLATTKDERILLAALAAVTGSEPALSRAGKIPQSYLPLCQDLLSRVKSFYPEAKQSCDAPPPSQPKTVTAANLIKKVPPVYPADARSRRIQGSVRFAADIAKDGSIKDLELLSGPLIFYDASRAAVRKWKYQPTMLDGIPVEVSTQIDVNFQLQQ